MHATGADVTEEGLRAWAQGVYPQEAAVEPLIRTGWTRRCAFKDEVVNDDNDRPWLDWDRLKPILDGDMPSAILAASGGELRVLRKVLDSGATASPSIGPERLPDSSPGRGEVPWIVVPLVLTALASLILGLFPGPVVDLAGKVMP